ncbi:Crp/Fnr family transcriptional regulator [Palleronia caenipelagi]|uniref:Crp/Fnr family transcriptional regulator n=1 Tax=Palleronia caenipelagi TaxID=2489174 RepID=UPI00163D5176|nr:Crp/Fnr family transcriptional regulator [Palleronia caenipelagi]
MTYPQEEQVLEQGTPSPGLFLIAHGRVDVFLNVGASEKVLLANLGPACTVGEIEAIAGRDCLASCIAQPMTTLLLCPTPALFEALRNRLFVQSVADVFCDRLDGDNRGKVMDRHGTIESRLMNLLETLRDHKYTVHTSQSALADMLDCSRQSVNKALASLRRKGLVECGKNRISLLSPEEDSGAPAGGSDGVHSPC